jgi:hypothetical protein
MAAISMVPTADRIAVGRTDSRPEIEIVLCLSKKWQSTKTNKRHSTALAATFGVARNVQEPLADPNPTQIFKRISDYFRIACDSIEISPSNFPEPDLN